MMDKIMQIYKEIILSDLSRDEKSRRIQSLIRIIIRLFYSYLKLFNQRIISIRREMTSTNPPLSPIISGLVHMNKTIHEQEKLMEKHERGFRHFMEKEGDRVTKGRSGSFVDLKALIRTSWERKSPAEKDEYMTKNNVQ